VCCSLSEDLEVVLRYRSALELNTYNASTVLGVGELNSEPSYS
jgi:hypothetical protein